MCLDSGSVMLMLFSPMIFSSMSSIRSITFLKFIDEIKLSFNRSIPLEFRLYSNSISKELYRESETTSEFSESNKVIDTNTNSENKLPDSNGITSDENESDNTNERIENSSDIKILEDE